MPARVILDIGPQDPETTAEFGNVGAGQAAKQLLQAHAELYNPELVGLLAQPRIEDASDALDHDEVERVVKPNGEIAGAGVHGDPQRPPDTWLVSYIYITEPAQGATHGRSARGVASYSQMTDSLAEYERRRDQGLFATVLAGPDGETQERTAFSSGEVEKMRDEIARLREELDEAKDPQPYDDYAEANVDDVVKNLRDRDLSDPEQYVAVQQLLDYEQRHKDRGGVTEVAERLLADEDERRQAAEAAAQQQE